MKTKVIVPTALIALAVFPLIVTNDYYLHLAILALMWVVIGTAWNLLAGFTGQVSFGHAVFFGIGAYSGGLLYDHLGWSAWWGLPVGALACALLALPFGWICFRLRGAYFALTTLALNEIMRHIATIWESGTGGMEGIMMLQTFYAPIASPVGMLSSKTPYYYIILIMAITTVGSVAFIMKSRLGYYLLSIREDQAVAESIGINAQLQKMISLVISAVFTGLAGVFYMNYMGFIDPETVFSLHNVSIMAILVAIVGGVGTVSGPVIGAFVMVLAQELFRTGGFGALPFMAKATGSGVIAVISDYFTRAHTLGFGVMVVLVILYAPRGIIGGIDRMESSVRAWRRKGETPQ